MAPVTFSSTKESIQLKDALCREGKAAFTWLFWAESLSFTLTGE
jgi:hypothetical protein